MPFVFLTLFIALFGALTPRARAEAEPPRWVLGQWVETHRLLSEERAAWEEEKASMLLAIELLERERGSLDEAIETERTQSDIIGGEGERTSREAGSLLSLSLSTSDELKQFETEVRELFHLFPLPLKEKIRPLARNIESSAGSSLLAERLRNVLGILLEAGQFDQAVSVHREVLEMDDGQHVEVNTLYLGLAQAYYVDRTGTRAGIGRPGPEGWFWSPLAELAPRVRMAVSMIEDGRKPAFIPLPVQLP